MVYKGSENLGDPNESLENNHILNPLAAPSTKHNIVWQYWNSRVKATLHCPCWKATMLLLKMPSSWQKVLHNSEPISPSDPFVLGILSSRWDPLCWTCMGIPSCWKRSFPGFDTNVHVSWRPTSFLLQDLVDQSLLGPILALLTLTRPESSKREPLLQMEA